MARPRKPTAVKKLQGTLQPCRTNFNEPVINESIAITPPDYLDSEAKKIYSYAIANCPDGLLSTLDMSVFATWADTYAKIIELDKAINDTGLYYTDAKTGITKPSPLISTQSDLKRVLKNLVNELGFSPASRSKITVNKKTTEKNDFLDL